MEKKTVTAGNGRPISYQQELFMVKEINTIFSYSSSLMRSIKVYDGIRDILRGVSGND